MTERWKSCLLTSRRYVPKILPRPREKNNISGQLKLMHGDTVNRGQGLLPYGGPGCKSESRGRERRMRGLVGRATVRVTQHPHPHFLTSVSRQQRRHLPLSPCSCSIQPPLRRRPAPAAPQGATLTGTCVELGSFIKACFFSSRWEDLNELSS